jgi:hypothetical protein
LTRAAFNRILGSIKQFLKGDYQKDNLLSIDGQFITDQNASSGLQKDLYGINEEVDKEDDIPLNRRDVNTQSKHSQKKL